jgi:hypothetical protein
MANNSNGNQVRDDEIVVLTENRDGKLAKKVLRLGSRTVRKRTLDKLWLPCMICHTGK